LAIATGLIIGALTEWSVPHLPFSLEPLGNSAAPWILVTFAVALTSRRTAESLILAVITLLALVSGFYVIEAWRGWGVSWHQVELWSAASVTLGPLVGLAASWLRRAGRTAGALGAGMLGGLLVGEAVYGLVKLKFSTPPAYWRVQLGLGIGLAVGLTLWRWRRHLLGSVPALAVSLAVCATVGLATLAVYQVP
jgi:xanthosine utilization system XapX-like protein